jgi:hypothetical protein
MELVRDNKPAPVYPLEVARELPAGVIRAFWHPEYGRLYLWDDVKYAFDYEGKTGNSVVRYMKGNLQNPALGLLWLERE